MVEEPSHVKQLFLNHMCKRGLSLVLSLQCDVVSHGFKSTQNQPRIIHHTTRSKYKTSPRALNRQNQPRVIQHRPRSQSTKLHLVLFKTQNQPRVIRQITRSKYKTPPRAFISCTMHHACQQCVNPSGETVPLNRGLGDL
jgi:hypothetical protein